MTATAAPIVLTDAQSSVDERVYALLSDINMVTSVDEIDTFWCGAPATEAVASVDGATAGDGHPLLSLSQHRREFSTCWLAFLRRSLSPDMCKRVLVDLDTHVIPHLSNPAVLIDFLTDAYNAGAGRPSEPSPRAHVHSLVGGEGQSQKRHLRTPACPGGVMSLLALRSLYYLIAHKNLYVCPRRRAQHAPCPRPRH